MDAPLPSYEVPQGRLMPLLITVLFALGLLYSAFLFFRQTSLEATLEELHIHEAELARQISVLEEQDVEALFVAQETQAQFSKEVVRWSAVIRDLQRLTPVGVFFSNYGLSVDGSIRVSGLADSYDAVSDLILALNSADFFQGVFVPNVTLGTASDGRKIVSFTLSLTADSARRSAEAGTSSASSTSSTSSTD